MSFVITRPVTHASASPIYTEPVGAVRNEAHSSGVSWAAAIAGAFVAAALSLILLALGAGIGLSAISPWAGAGASGSAVSKGAIVWTILMEIISSAFGGYLAGRRAPSGYRFIPTKFSFAIPRTVFWCGPWRSC